MKLVIVLFSLLLAGCSTYNISVGEVYIHLNVDADYE